MKIGILSDIHGNIDALRNVHQDLLREEVDILFVLGDCIGYYYEAKEVLELLDEWPHRMISGNHERIFIKCLQELPDQSYLEEITRKYGGSFRYYVESFNNELVQRISNLPDSLSIELEGIKFILCHGSPTDSNQYIYPDCEVYELKKVLPSGYDVIFNGHTHYPMIFTYDNVKLFNVGSVGQSRTRGGIANWAIFNTNNQVYTPKSTPFDVTKSFKRLKKHSETKQYLFDILKRNNTLID